MASQRGELFSFLLHLYPLEPEQLVARVTASQVQAAFLDMVRQIDPTLFEWLREADQHAPYTVALLQERDQVAPILHEETGLYEQIFPARSGRACWLNITILDAALFSAFAQYLIVRPYALTVKIGEIQFGVRRFSTKAEPDTAAQTLIAYSSFEDLYGARFAQRQYRFDFMSPTFLDNGRQRSWGKAVQTFPEPHYVFASLARQWELFAPAHLRMKMHDISVRAFSLWCERNIVVAYYAPTTGYARSNRSEQAGFQGTVVYEVRGRLTAPEARWLSPLARFATFSGVGGKTAVGMGRTRCTNLVEAPLSILREEMQ
jgi:CRISPR-associated endoribonuclease Cas6